MENFTSKEFLSYLLLHYGSIAIFGLLFLGIIALPVPEETLMVITGVLMHQEKLSIPSTICAAYLGSICGITMSYMLGRTTGYYLIRKYGGWLGITEEKIKKIEDRFTRYGTWTLFIGYFIPGVRHFTGFCAGTTALNVSKFALFAYSGAFFWVTTFLSLGYFLGDYWSEAFQDIEIKTEWIVILSIACIVLGAIFFIRYKRKKKSRDGDITIQL